MREGYVRRLEECEDFFPRPTFPFQTDEIKMEKAQSKEGNKD